MAQIKLAEYTFDNSVGDVMPSLIAPNTITMTKEDSVSGTITRRIVYIDNGKMPTELRFGGNTYNNSLLTVEYLNIDSNITNLHQCFYRCQKLQRVNTSNWNTSNVTNFTRFCDECSSLVEIDVSHFNVSKANGSFYMMFHNVKKAEVLDVSKWNVDTTDGSLASMFENCSNIKELDLSNWKVKIVHATGTDTCIRSMFSGCSSLEYLDLSGFDFSEMNASMTVMFKNCSSLREIKGIENFNVSKVKEFYAMFYNCSSLQTLDVSNWNTKNVTNMKEMFYGCSSLQTLDVSNWDISSVTDMSGMFAYCGATSINTKGWDTSNVTNMSQMFRGMKNIVTLDLSNFDTSKVSEWAYFASECSNLKNIDVSSFVSNLTTEGYLFLDNPSLESIDISNWETPKNFGFYFRNNSKLKTIGMLYCSAESINNLLSTGFPITTLRKGITIYYYDADPSQLTPVEGVTFKKYATSTTIQLPPHIQLHSFPDGTRDEVDIKTGILTRNIGRLILDGSANKYNSALFIKKQSTVMLQCNAISDMKVNSPILSDTLPNGEAWDTEVEAIDCHLITNTVHFNLSYERLEGYELTLNGAKAYLSDNPITVYYQLETPTTEKIILNYNNSCDYGRILPTGMCDKYDVVNSKYTQTMTSILLDGENAWDAMEEFENTIKFTATGATVGVGNLNMLGAGGLYCDNDLFPNINDDSDVEHCRVDAQGNKFYIYINKTRLMSPDLIGYQIWLQQNNFNLIYELNTHIKYAKPYEELDPTQARWEGMDCMRDGTISYHANNSDNITLYPTLEYIAPSSNSFKTNVLKPNTQYSVYAQNTVEGQVLNLGGNPVEFANGTTFTSGTDDRITFDNAEFLDKVVIVEGDVTNESVPYFTGMQSVKMPVLTTYGKNLFDVSRHGSLTPQPTGDIQLNSAKWGKYDVKYILKPNTQYTLTILGDGTKCWIAVFVDGSSQSSNVKTSYTKTFSTNSNGEVTIGIYANSDKYVGYSLKSISIEEGTVSTPYEPYNSNILTTSEEVELRGIGDVKDELNLETGELIQRIGTYTFTGDEPWMIGEPTEGVKYFLLRERHVNPQVLGGVNAVNLPIICNRLPTIKYSEFTTDNSGINFTYDLRMNFADCNCNQGATAEDLMAYLKANPTTIYYPITPITRTVNLTWNLCQYEKFYQAVKSLTSDILNVYTSSDTQAPVVDLECSTGSISDIEGEIENSEAISFTKAVLTPNETNIVENPSLTISERKDFAPNTPFPTTDTVKGVNFSTDGNVITMQGINTGYVGYDFVNNYASTSLVAHALTAETTDYYKDKILAGAGKYTLSATYIVDVVKDNPSANVISLSVLYDDEKLTTHQISSNKKEQSKTTTFTAEKHVNGMYISVWYQDTDTSKVSVKNIKLEKDGVPSIKFSTNEEITLRAVGDLKDELDLLTGNLTQRINEDGEILTTPITKAIDISITNQANEPMQFKAPACTNTEYLHLSSDNSILPTMHYAIPSKNSFYLPSIKTGTLYTLKYPLGNGTIQIGSISYNITSDSMLFTTPLSITGDKNIVIFPNDDNPQDVILLEGSFRDREIEYFTGMKSVVNPTITIQHSLTGAEQTYKLPSNITLRSLPNGVADTIDIVNGRLTQSVGYREYQDGDNELQGIYTDGYHTIYGLPTPTISNIVFPKPTINEYSIMKLSSDELIPQLTFRALSSNHFPLDLLEPNATYTLKAKVSKVGSFTLGGTYTNNFFGTTVIPLQNATNNSLIFDGGLGVSEVVLVKGDVSNLTVPYFSDLLSVNNGTISITGKNGELNTLSLDDNGIILRSCGTYADIIDLTTGVLTIKVGETTFKGVENWQKITNDTVGYSTFRLALQGVAYSNNGTIICNRFKHKYDAKAEESVYAYNNAININIKESTIGGDTVDAFKLWLGRNNVTVVYQLSNPLEIPLVNVWTTMPPTSYEKSTTITTVTQDISLKPLLNATVAITTLEQIATNLEAQNIDLQQQNESLDQENVATMLALTDLYETMIAPMAIMSLDSDPYAMSTMSLDDEEPVTNVVGYTVSPMGMVYAKLVHRGLKTIEEVPYNLQVEVMYALKGME